MARIWTTVFLAIVVSGCATANVTSVRRAGSEDASFSRIMVWVLIEDLALRRAFEEAAIDAGGDAFVPGTSVLFPGQAYTAEQVGVELERASIDAVLTVSVTDASQQASGFVPGTSQVLCAQPGADGSCRSGTVVTTVPTAVVTSAAQFQAVLQAVTDEQAVWTATADASRGSGQNPANQLVSVAARELAESLVGEGLVSVGSR